MDKLKFLLKKSNKLIRNMNDDENFTELYADSIMIDIILQAMSYKLRIARENGRYGWWNPEQISEEELLEQLNDNMKEGDLIDVINLASMLFVRRQSAKYEEANSRLKDPELSELKFPARYICHWPSGSTQCCEAHATLLSNLALHMRLRAPIEIIKEPAECVNCLNEAKAKEEDEVPPPGKCLICHSWVHKKDSGVYHYFECKDCGARTFKQYATGYQPANERWVLGSTDIL